MPTAEETGQAFVEDYLAHHGVKGMHWGHRKSHPGGGDHEHVSSKDVYAARQRHQGRMVKIDAHARALTIAGTTAEKQKHLTQIHRLAKEARTSGDIEKAHRLTTQDKVISGLAGSLVATPGVGTVAGIGGAKVLNMSLANQHRKLVNSYEKSTLHDYH